MARRNYGGMVKGAGALFVIVCLIMLVLWIANFMFGVFGWWSDFLAAANEMLAAPFVAIDQVVSDIGTAMGGVDYGTDSSYVEVTTGIANFVSTNTANVFNWFFGLFGQAAQGFG